MHGKPSVYSGGSNSAEVDCKALAYHKQVSATVSSSGKEILFEDPLRQWQMALGGLIQVLCLHDSHDCVRAPH